MIPLYLDPAQARVALIGRGVLASRRLSWLRDGGAAPDIWSDQPTEDFAASAGKRLQRRLPTAAELGSYHAIWVADLPSGEAETIAAAAREARVLVNVEDVVPLCDFHTPAVLRRGRLALTAGTGGASPAVARAARELLEAAFPENWAEALEEIADARAALRRNGARPDELATDARRRLAEHGLT